MYKNILIPTDGSTLSGKAVGAGIALAATLGARITALLAPEPFALFSLSPEQVEYVPADYARHVAEEGQRILHRIAELALAGGVPCETVLREHAHAHEAIIETARLHGCDLILMASHGRRGVSALVLGSVTTKVLTHSDIPVLVYR